MFNKRIITIIILLLIILILILCLLMSYRSYLNENFESNNIDLETKVTQNQENINVGDTLFTCTSYITLPNKFEELDRALSTFFKYNNSNRIREFILINEYDPISDYLIEKIKNKYPNIIIWNKSEDQKGQAKSLNMVIDYLKQNNYKYWLHWEESWYCLDRFIDKMLNIMDNNNINQFSLRYNLFEILSKENRLDFLDYVDYDDHTEIIPKDINRYDVKTPWYNNLCNWPLFSLMPGIDKVDTILKTGYFSTDSEKWPIIFEYEFACEWIKHINRIAGFKKEYISRNSDHKSTYSDKK